MIAGWDPLILKPQLVSIGIVTIVIIVLSLIYFFKNKKLKANEAPTGFVLMVEIYIGYFRNMVVELLGPKMEKITPYILYLFTYIALSNLIGLFGFESPTGCYTVTLSLAFVTWVGVFVVGFKYQKLSYLKNFCFCVKTKKGKKIPVMINPLEMMSNIAPLISLSFRLWGNILAGGLIMTLWFYFTNYVWMNVPVIGLINILGGLTAAPLRAFFDIMSGVIQALVFATLTIMYWTMAKGDEQPAVAPNTNS